MNWLREKLRNWLIGDVDEKLALALQTMKAIEAQGLEKIQEEMGSMFYTFPFSNPCDPSLVKKRVAVKDALSLLFETLGLYLTLETCPGRPSPADPLAQRGELFPVIKQIRKPVAKPKLKKLLDKSEKGNG